MYLSIIIFPLLGSISSGFLGRKLGVTGSHIITCTCLIISSILITIAFYEVGICGSPVTIKLFSWIDSEFMSISWEFLFDQLTVSLSLAVIYCSTLIHIYSVDYLSNDPHNQRFFSYLSLFTFFMLFLVSAGNYFVMFIGWEGIGIVSYLLINFYFTRIQSNKAAILALTMNRVGDFGLSIAFFALFAVFGSLNFATIYSLAPFINETAITIIALLLLTGAAAKSSQLGLHSWLPGSMEAPTPVSALLHAATYLNFLNIILTHIFYIKALTHQKGRSSPSIFGGRQSPFFKFKNNSYNKSFHSNAHHTKVGIRREGDDFFIPWKLTYSGINALNSIKKFHNWLPLNSPIRLFIDNHCSCLFKTEPGLLGEYHTNINKSYFTVESMLKNNKLIDCANLRTAKKAFSDINNSYIYAFINKDTQKFYKGSTINPISRLHNYIHSWSYSRQRLLLEMRKTGGGFKNYYFFPGFSVPNYLNLFTKLNPTIKLNPKDKFILNCLSEYHVRLLEQSIISFIKPDINDINVAVSYSFINIDIINYQPTKSRLKSHIIYAYDKKGNLFYEYASINQAKFALGLTDYKIRWNRNKDNRFIYCPKLGIELRIFDSTLKISSSFGNNRSLSSFKNLVSVKDINLNNIPMNVIYAYLDDKKTLYGIFNNATEFALSHGLNPWQAYKYINKERAIPIKIVKIAPAVYTLFIYLCCNPIYLKNKIDIQSKQYWPVVSIDTTENNLVRFHDTPNAARIELSALLGITNLKPTRNFTQSYITGPIRKGVKMKLSKFKNRFILLWLKYFEKNSKF